MKLKTAGALLIITTLYLAQPSSSLPGAANQLDKLLAVEPEANPYPTVKHGTLYMYNYYISPAPGSTPWAPCWSPDGKWIAFISNEAGLPQLGLLETYGGMQKKVVITNRQWRRPMGRLQVRVVEGSTGQLTAARILGLAPDGRFYPPVDTYARIGVNDRHYFHTQGEFTVDVPPGKMILEAVKGFEFQPFKQEITIRPHEAVSTTLTLERLANCPAKGWYSGSTHVHMNYGGNLHNTPQNTAEMSNAEDLHFIHAMVANKDNRVLDWQYFRPGGGEYPVERPIAGVKIHIGEEYRPAFLGHTFLIGLRGHLISPFTASYEGTAIDSIYPSNTDIFRKAKGQGAVTGYVHPFGDTDPLESGLGAKGFAVDAVLGALDALEWSGAVRAEMGVWQREMNNDVALTPTGGEDSINDLQRCRTLGGIRTYVHLDDPFSVESWIEGLRQGHTFFSTGPLLDFHMNDKLPGDRLHLPATGGTVTLEGSVVSVGQLSKVVIYCRQGILREIPLDAGGHGAHFREVVPLTDSNWFSLSAEGPYYPPLDAKYALAGTNSVRVYVGERKIRSRPDAEYFLRWIDLLEQQTEKWPWWRSPAEEEHILGQYEEARRVYRRFIDEAQQQDLLY
jgi:WD40-like Beta Propeller Repeat